ncbi:MAG: ABC transporter substrate-binding protein, partial [SAR324 cluster bacterium]|nr:ABC transporter substrate-binding protein [SAR324 cluster bacterium]
ANPKSAMTARVFAAYKRQFNEVMPSHAVYSYQGVKIFAAALEKSGSRDREALREALSKTRVNEHILPQGTIMFGADGQNVNARAAMMQILDQKVQVVWPNTYAQAKPIFPQ